MEKEASPDDHAAEGKKISEEEEEKVKEEMRDNGEISKKAEKVCRICHLGGGSEVVALGCDCKGDLGFSHTQCAQTWFAHRDNRLCEICGKTIKNIESNSEETSIFMTEWNEMRIVATTLGTSEGTSNRCRKSLYSLLLACLILAFVVAFVISS